MNSLALTTRRGSTMVMVVLLLLIVGVGGYFLSQSMKEPATSTTTNTNTSVTNQAVADDDVPSAPTVTSADDLTAAEATLDSVDVNVNASDETTLDTYLGEF